MIMEDLEVIEQRLIVKKFNIKKTKADLFLTASITGIILFFLFFTNTFELIWLALR